MKLITVMGIVSSACSSCSCFQGLRRPQPQPSLPFLSSSSSISVPLLAEPPPLPPVIAEFQPFEVRQDEVVHFLAHDHLDLKHVLVPLDQQGEPILISPPTPVSKLPADLLCFTGPRPPVPFMMVQSYAPFTGVPAVTPPLMGPTGAPVVKTITARRPRPLKKPKQPKNYYERQSSTRYYHSCSKINAKRIYQPNYHRNHTIRNQPCRRS